MYGVLFTITFHRFFVHHNADPRQRMFAGIWIAEPAVFAVAWSILINPATFQVRHCSVSKTALSYAFWLKARVWISWKQGSRVCKIWCVPESSLANAGRLGCMCVKCDMYLYKAVTLFLSCQTYVHSWILLMSVSACYQPETKMSDISVQSWTQFLRFDADIGLYICLQMDLFAKMLFYFALVMGVLVLYMVHRHFLWMDFKMNMWAFGFPTAALAWAGILYNMSVTTVLAKILAVVLVSIANFLCVVLVLRTFIGVFRRKVRNMNSSFRQICAYRPFLVLSALLEGQNLSMPLNKSCLSLPSGVFL